MTLGQVKKAIGSERGLGDRIKLHTQEDSIELSDQPELDYAK